MHKLREQLAFHKTGFRLLKITHSMNETILPTRLLESFFRIVVMFVSLILSAELIDALLQKAYAMAAGFALAAILLNLVFGIAGHFFGKAIRKNDVACTLEFTKLLREKMMAIDYELIENPEVIEKIRFAERSMMMHGGLSSVVNHYKTLLESAVIMTISLGMIFF